MKHEKTPGKLTSVTLAVVGLFGAIDRTFVHMRTWSYLASGGEMLCIKVAR